MTVFQAYTLATASWLTLQAVPLLLFPKLVFTLLFASDSATTMTNHVHGQLGSDLEIYLARTLAVCLLVLAALSMILSGRIPLTSLTAESEVSPYAKPTTTLTMIFHAINLIGCYLRWRHDEGATSGGPGYLLGMMGNGILTAWAIGYLVFEGGDQAGRKARVSGWPFSNETERRAKLSKGKGGKAR